MKCNVNRYKVMHVEKSPNFTQKMKALSSPLILRRTKSGLDRLMASFSISKRELN